MPGTGRTGIIIGKVRIQPLSETLVRLEQRGPKGFEDRATFMVTDRKWPGTPVSVKKTGAITVVSTPTYQVRIKSEGVSLKGLQVCSKGGQVFYACDGKIPPVTFLPSPGEEVKSWVLPDHPRLVPPEWGATPPPDKSDDPLSGWDVTSGAPDLYVFLPGQEGYPRLRQDVLKLTGPIALPPLYTFGLIYSRWHPYSDQDVLAVIERFRRRQIPLDMFVVDTDWRVGSSHGYEVNRSLFPDLAGFIRRAHGQHVFLMFNDHPEPVAETALDPTELRYRYRELTRLLKLGMDVWWYDRNWDTVLKEPAQGLRKEVWGMRLFHDITQRCRPGRRPLILSNVPGIDNGLRNHAPHPASHRYPFWWTGDTSATWEDLERGVRNAVDSGTISLLPYLSEDLGGHFGNLTPELYVRYVQFGALSPITRLHSTRGNIRYPWAFGAGPEAVVTEFIRLRYRLMPVIYGAARRAWEDGTPLLRRCDLHWPRLRGFASSDQYLLGDDLLVAPIYESNVPNYQVIPGTYLKTPEGKPGMKGAYFKNVLLRGIPALVRQDPGIDFRWQDSPPAEGLSPERLSVRWTGCLGPIPKTGEYSLVLQTSNAARLWVGEKPVLEWSRNQAVTLPVAKLRLEQGKTYPLRLEAFGKGGVATCRLLWRKDPDKPVSDTRRVWIPPGTWQDAWTGASLTGPQTITTESPLWHLPIYVREGGIVFSIPPQQYTGERPWSTVIADAFVSSRDGTGTRLLYEDDGISNDYLKGSSCKTPVTLQTKRGRIALTIGKMAGSYKGALRERNWVLRLHLPRERSLPESVVLQGRRIAIKPYPGRESSPYAWMFPPSDKASQALFAGRDSCPPPESGPVLEAWVPGQDSCRELELMVTGKASKRH